MTDKTLEVGMENYLEMRITDDHSATHLGSGDVSVLSTPSMILFMEKTAGTLAGLKLPSEKSTVGTVVNIKHLKAVKVGETVTTMAKLIEIDRRRLVFEVKVKHGETLIGEGLHERFIIDKQKFLASL